MSRVDVLTVALSLLVVGVGCTKTFTPTPVAIERGRIKSLNVQAPIAITNAQSATDLRPMASQGVLRLVANYHAWTEAAVLVMQTELRNRGMPLNGPAGKELKLKIVGARASLGAFVDRCTTDLQVETGDGTERQFEGGAGSGLGFEKACRVAVARAVSRALTDPAIVSYVEGAGHGEEGRRDSAERE